jgi:leucyl/phenylalanyl-tRNA---protein transferase
MQALIPATTHSVTMHSVFPPIEPEPTSVIWPRAEAPEEFALAEHDVVARGTDYRPGTLLAAYRNGIFPWPHSVALPGLRGLSQKSIVLWCSPEERAHFPLTEELRWSRSLRRTLRTTRFQVRHNTAFEQVMIACGTEREGGTWITPELRAGYLKMHQLGFAHSVEVWDEHELAGGIYGVAIGSIFAGESMFHRRTDASKIAFAALAHALVASGFTWFDVQVQNPHLESLGCQEVARDTFLAVVVRERNQLRKLSVKWPL